MAIIQTSLCRGLTLFTIAAAGLACGSRNIRAQSVAAPDRQADTAVDPILQRSETAAIVFGRIYTSDSRRIIFQTGNNPDDYDYTEYEVGANTEVFIDGTPADLAGHEFEPGAPATLVPHGENSFMLEQIYVRDPDSPLERPAPPPLPTNVEGISHPEGDRESGLEVNRVPEVPVGAEFVPDRRGIRIVVIEANGPLSETEFRPGDTIIHVDGKPVLTADSMYRRLHQFQPGDVVELVALRDRERIRDEFTLPEDFRPAPRDELRTFRRGGDDRTKQETSSAPVVDLGWFLVNTRNGVLIYEIQPAGAADHSGLREGDRIVSVNGVDVDASRDVYYRLHHFSAGESVDIGIIRDDERMNSRIVLPEDFEPYYPAGADEPIRSGDETPAGP